MFKYSDDLVESLFMGIYSGKIRPRFLPTSLYYAIADYLKKGLYEGYGTTFSSLSKAYKPVGYNLADFELLTEMRTNVYLFSAAKTYQQVRTMTDQLIGDNGAILPFKQFREKADETYKLYNKTWLQTEYDTAIGQAQNGRKWKEIERQADVLPLLEYSAVLDSRTSEICRPLDGITAPVNDPIWKKVAPLNHFNCRCMLKQVADGKVTSQKVKDEKVEETLGMMDDLFKMNPGQTGYVFSKKHPYFQVPKNDREYAKRNFDMPLPKTD